MGIASMKIEVDLTGTDQFREIVLENAELQNKNRCLRATLKMAVGYVKGHVDKGDDVSGDDIDRLEYINNVIAKEGS